MEDLVVDVAATAASKGILGTNSTVTLLLAAIGTVVVVYPVVVAFKQAWSKRNQVVDVVV